MDDFSFGTWSGAGDLSVEDRVCVYVRFGRPYQLQAVGAGAGGGFDIASGSESLAYQVYFDDRAGSGNAVQLSPGVWLTGQTGSSRRRRCRNRRFAGLTVRVLASDLAAAAAGSYFGTLILTVQPE